MHREAEDAVTFSYATSLPLLAHICSAVPRCADVNHSPLKPRAAAHGNEAEEEADQTNVPVTQTLSQTRLDGGTSKEMKTLKRRKRGQTAPLSSSSSNSPSSCSSTYLDQDNDDYDSELPAAATASRFALENEDDDERISPPPLQQCFVHYVDFCTQSGRWNTFPLSEGKTLYESVQWWLGEDRVVLFETDETGAVAHVVSTREVFTTRSAKEQRSSAETRRIFRCHSISYNADAVERWAAVHVLVAQDESQWATPLPGTHPVVVPRQLRQPVNNETAPLSTHEMVRSAADICCTSFASKSFLCDRPRMELPEASTGSQMNKPLVIIVGYPPISTGDVFQLHSTHPTTSQRVVQVVECERSAQTGLAMFFVVDLEDGAHVGPCLCTQFAAL